MLSCKDCELLQALLAVTVFSIIAGYLLLGGRATSCWSAWRRERVPLRLGNGLNAVQFRAIDVLRIVIGIDWILGFLGNVLFGYRKPIMVSILLTICTHNKPFSAVLRPSRT